MVEGFRAGMLVDVEGFRLTSPAADSWSHTQHNKTKFNISVRAPLTEITGSYGVALRR